MYACFVCICTCTVCMCNVRNLCMLCMLYMLLSYVIHYEFVSDIRMCVCMYVNVPKMDVCVCCVRMCVMNVMYVLWNFGVYLCMYVSCVL